MQAVMVVFVSGKMVEVDTYTRPNGCDLNATARCILEEVREYYPEGNISCAIYLAANGRLAFAGEERLEDCDYDD